MTLPLDLSGLDEPGSHPLHIVAPPLVITVLGKPITQGSKTKTKWGMYDDNAATLKPWRDSVTTAAVAARGDRPRITGPVEVHVWFYFERPAAHYGTGRNAQVLKPQAPAYPDSTKSGDIDKLQRAAFDALTTAGVWKDDCLVARVTAEKLWTGGNGMQLPGMRLHVTELQP